MPELVSSGKAKEVARVAEKIITNEQTEGDVSEEI